MGRRRGYAIQGRVGEGWTGFMTSTTASDGAMRGLKGVVFGVANSRSIAWGIAKAARADLQEQFAVMAVLLDNAVVVASHPEVIFAIERAAVD